MRLGVCWYPEQWPEERWAVDARAMAEAGLELVRVGEFAWARLEPERGVLHTDWLDRVLDVLEGAALQVVLGTPTATPPVWLTRERPEVVSVAADGRRRASGSRRHTCPTAPAYRQEARRITQILVDRYGAHPAVVAWQVDNEPGNHDSARCWCDSCQRRFTAWLQDRYGDVDTLNAAWGTVFWSGAYPDLDAVALPVPTVTAHSPSLLLAHRRFASAMAAEALAEQRAVIAAGSPGRAVFTNLYYGDRHVDAAAVAAPTGIAAQDSYPHDTAGPAEVAFTLDLARGSARGPAAPLGRLWVTEQQPGPINWTPRKPLVPPGQVRVWSWQAALHGAEALLYFRWRAARAGQEQYHAGLLRHDADVDRGLDEVRRVAGERGDLPAVPSRAPVALLHSYEDAWAIGIDPHLEGLRHRDLVLPAYTAAYRLGLDVDVCDPEEDLTAYAVVLAPALHLCTPGRLRALREALASGALVVLGPRSLVKDTEDVWLDVPVPGGLVDELDATVVESGTTESWPPSWPSDPVTVDGEPAGPWVDVLRTGSRCEVLARYAGRHLAGAAAVVRNGGLVHVGASSDEVWLTTLARLLDRTPHPPHLEVVERAGVRFVLDHRALIVRREPAVPQGS